MLRSETVTLSEGDETDGVPTRADVIAGTIRQAVIEHRVAPGTRLSEDQIGAMFGASRTIVRAALQTLAHDHIVTLAKNRGASVASPSIADARHLFDARRALEDLIVRRAAERMTDRDERGLAELIARGRRAMESADRGLAIRLSGEFHLQIAAVAAQPILRSFLVELISRSSLVIALYGRTHHSDCAGEEHGVLLAALAARDAEAAAGLMRDHLAHIEADLNLAEAVRPPTPLREALFARHAGLIPLAGAARPEQRRSGQSGAATKQRPV